MRLDAHQHFWSWSDDEYAWITDDQKILRQDYLPQHLEPLLRENGIEGTIAVQARQSLTETDYLVALSDTTGFIKGVVGWVDLLSEDLSPILDRYGNRLVGVRHLIHDEPDPAFMMNDRFRRGIGMLAGYDLTYDLLIRPEHLENSLRLVDEFPDQAFVIDHIGKPDIAGGEKAFWQRGIRKLAERDHVYCKLSGMVTEAAYHHWNDEEIPLAEFIPFMDTVLEHFGAERVMFGSDWPVCTLAASYDEVIDIVSEWILTLSSSEQRQIMGETATRFYHLDQEKAAS